MNWLWVRVLGALVPFPLLLFPDGQLPSPRWRGFACFTGLLIALWVVIFALSGAEYVAGRGVAAPNPYASEGVEQVSDVAKVVLALGFIATLIAIVVSLVGRFRRGGDVERAQLKWLILAGVVSVLFLMLPGDHGGGNWVDIAGGLVWALLPISIGIAILRHGVHEIDRIISRTVTYAVVIVMIVAVYIVVVSSLSVVLPETGAPAVTAATLAAAALFRLLLSRVRVAVYRRFNRSRYDARIAADGFGQRLRHTSDIEAVEADLDSSVTRALEPSKVSPWMRQP